MRAPVTVEAVHFVRTFPWLRMGRAVGCALTPQALAIAFLATLTLQVVTPWLGPVAVDLTDSRLSLLGWSVDLSRATPPLFAVTAPTTQLPAATWSSAWGLWAQFGLAAFVWSFAGVAVCRCAAVEFCRDEGPSFRAAVQWSSARLATPWGALATPLGGACLLLLGLVAIALPATIPGLGGAWGTIVSPLVGALAIAAAFILLVLPLLWPLALAAIAVDDSDGFDAFSRGFSYLTSHPWALAALIGIALVVQQVTSGLLDLLGATAIDLSAWATASLLGPTAGLERVTPAAAWWIAIGVNTVRASLFWSLTTIVYVLARQLTDATPLDQLRGYELFPPSDDPIPLAGIPAVAATVPAGDTPTAS
jgi:hypothetical protein